MASTSASASPGPSDSTPSLAQLGFIVLPGVPISPNGLQTNDDGQWSIITRTEISIFVSRHSSLASNADLPTAANNKLTARPL